MWWQNALAYYLGCIRDVLLTRRIAHLEAKMVALKAEVEELQVLVKK